MYTVQRMKSTLDKLSVEERDALSRLYENPSWKSVVKLIELERLELAKDAFEKTDIMEIRYLKGQADGLKRFFKTVKDNYRKTDDSA